jgi:hypothetical protein
MQKKVLVALAFQFVLKQPGAAVPYICKELARAELGIEVQYASPKKRQGRDYARPHCQLTTGN